MKVAQLRSPWLSGAAFKAAVALCLCLSGSFTASALRLSPAQSADEEAVRALTEQYGQAIAAGDLRVIRQCWDPQSSNVEPQLNIYRGIFLSTRLVFVGLKVTHLEVTGTKAVAHLTTDERQMDKRTGVSLSLREVFHGNTRVLEWSKTDAGWKIEREFVIQVQLAINLEAAASDRERHELLEKESAFISEVLPAVLLVRGDRHRMREDYDKALLCYRLAQEISEKIGDEIGVAATLDSIGIVKTAQGNYQEAMPLEQKALALHQAAGTQRGVALVLDHLSTLYRLLGNYRQSFECAQKSLRLYEEVNYRRGEAEALISLASLYSLQNNSLQALAHLERVMKISEEVGDVVQIALTRSHLAHQHLALGHYAQALELYQQVLQQTESHGDQIGAAGIRDQIGQIYFAQGRYREALNYHRQALSMLDAANSKMGLAQALVHLSQTYWANGQDAEALPPAERAVSLSRQRDLPLDLWAALTALGYCQLALKHPAEARQAFSEAVSIIEKLRAQTTGGPEESERSFEGGLGAYQGLLSLLAKDNQPREALVFAERTKARVLLDVLQQGRVSIEKAMTQQEREQEQRLKSELTWLNTQLTRATQSDQPDAARLNDLKPRLEKARLNYEAFQTSLYAGHPELKINRGEAPIIKAEEMAALLPDAASALLEYGVTDDQTFLFAVTKAAGKDETEVRLYQLPIKRDELTKQIGAFREQLAGRDLGFRAAAQKLYELLLKPAQVQLKGKTNLVIVPDDKLWDLPFQALETGANRFLIEDAAIAYAPSLTVLREMTKRRKAQDAASASAPLLALGNPAATIERATLGLRDESPHPLPEAEQEVRTLGQLYGSLRSKVYIGAEAREDRVKAEAGQANVLHFATHGILNNTAPMYSYLVLAPGDAHEDGLLEAWEIMQLDLKADLAVLSACETARGRFGAGEGMIGLTWALFVAGVPSTVVSQWQVESASTRDLMVSFHRALKASPAAGQASLTKAEALRQAALKLLKDPETRHPFYWAGFVLVGDGR